MIALSLAALAALGAVILTGPGRDGRPTSAPQPAVTGPRPSPFEGSLLPRGVRAPDFALQNQDGELVRMRGLRGRPVVVNFLYTTCRETCPLQAQQVKGALDELGHDVPALAIAVDPARDTPANARRFLREQRMVRRLDFILGSEAELRPLWRGYSIQPQLPDAEHQAKIFLVDGRGMQRVSFPLDQATPERIAHDLRLLEAEARG